MQLEKVQGQIIKSEEKSPLKRMEQESHFLSETSVD